MIQKKIAVYAIAKNEAKFVDRWYESMREADQIYVLDIGSTDDTVEKLKSHGVIVKTEIIKPWRFDVARNKSLDMVPNDVDICVCTDLDEVLESGWRKKLESSFGDANRLRYKYNWSIDEKGNPIVSFLYEKIHDRKHYKWIYPVHEVLKCSLDNEKININEDIILNHYPDKTKSRSQYLELLELSHKENPNDDRILHYLGREYMYYQRWNESIDTLIKHTNITNSWYLERAASMRFISRCYQHLNRYEEAELWLKKAIDTSPNARESYVEMSFLKFNQKKYIEVIDYLNRAKIIPKNEMLYINEPFCWDATIDDLLSISYYNLGLKEEALFYIDKALEFDCENQRLLNNKRIFLA